MSQSGRALLYSNAIDHHHVKLSFNGSRRAASVTISLLVALLVVVSGLFMSNASSKKADAVDWGIPMFCPTDTMGYGMSSHNPWESILTRIPSSDKGNRTYTLQEAFGGNVGFVNYDGAGKGTSWTREFPDKDLKNIENGKADTVKDKLNAKRNGPTCSFGSTMTATANGLMGITSFISGIAQLTTTAAFDPEFICKNEGQSGCIDVAAITGGSNGQKGIIGTLTTGLLIPLSTLIALIAVIMIVFSTIRSRSYRQGLVYFGGLVLVYVLGIAFVSNPSFLARLPMQASSVITSSVITPFVNATSGDGNSTTSSGDEVCQAASGGASADQQMALTVSSLNCRIWKAFVLNPYSQASFGRSYESLDTNNQDITKALSDAGYSADDIAVPLTSTAAPSTMRGQTLKLDGSTPVVKNLAAYQLYLQTNAAKDNDASYLSKQMDTRWYRVVLPTATNDDMWNTWSFSFGSYFRRMAYAFVALIATLIGTALICFTALLALVWLFVAMLAICLLPIFLLIGLEQTRGRRILFKYLMELGTILAKYFISLIFVILTIVLYGFILGSIDTVAMTFLAAILLTLALFMFRGRILGMFGDTNLLGAGSVGGKIGDFAKSGFKKSRSLVGGATGSVIAERAFTPNKMLGAAARGATDTFKRDVTRKDGFLSNSIRQGNRISEDNKKDMRDRAAQNTEKGDNLSQLAAGATQGIYDQNSKVQDIDRERNTVQKNLDEIRGNAEIVQKSQEEVLLEMQNSGGDDALFAGLQQMRNELGDINTELATAQLTGNASPEEMSALQKRRDEIANSLQSRENLLAGNKDLSKQELDYNQRLSSEITGRGGYEFSPNDAEKIVKFNQKLRDLTEAYNAESNVLDDMVDKHSQLVRESANYHAAGDLLMDQVVEHRPGEFISQRKVNKANDLVGEKLSDRAQERFDLSNMENMRPGASSSSVLPSSDELDVKGDSVDKYSNPEEIATRTEPNSDLRRNTESAPGSGEGNAFSDQGSRIESELTEDLSRGGNQDISNDGKVLGYSEKVKPEHNQVAGETSAPVRNPDLIKGNDVPPTSAPVRNPDLNKGNDAPKPTSTPVRNPDLNKGNDAPKPTSTPVRNPDLNKGNDAPKPTSTPVRNPDVNKGNDAPKPTSTPVRNPDVNNNQDNKSRARKLFIPGQEKKSDPVRKLEIPNTREVKGSRSGLLDDNSTDPKIENPPSRVDLPSKSNINQSNKDNTNGGE